MKSVQYLSSLVMLLGTTILSYNNVSNVQNIDNNNLITIEERSNQINLSKIRIKEFKTDLSIFDNTEINKEDYLEEIKWGMIDQNSQIEDELFDIWDSIQYDYPDNWEIYGLDWIVPEKGDQFTVRIRLNPVNLKQYTGSLSFKTTFVNEIKSIIDISNIVENTSIGTIEDNTSTVLREKVEAKNSDKKIKWNQLRFINITKNDAKLEAISNSLYYKGAVGTNFKIGEKLSNVIKVLNLGKFEEEVTSNSILKVLKIKNSSIKTNQLKVTNINLDKKTASILPINDSGDYIGEVEVRFINAKALTSVVLNRNLGYFTNPTQEKLKSKIILLNTQLKKDDFVIDIKTLTYKKLEIVAKTDSAFFGRVALNFSSTVTTDIKYDSGLQHVNVYNSKLTDIQNDTIRYTPEFGKNALLEKYSTIKIDTILNSKFNNQVHHENKSKKFQMNLNATSGYVEFYNFNYTNVNWMKSYSRISYEWIGDTMKISIMTGVEAYASAWNAYWAQSEAKTEITNFYFL